MSQQTPPPPQLPPIPPNIGLQTGPLLIGVFFNSILYGILVSQTYLYATSFPDDRITFKILVAVVFLLETLQVACTEADIFYWFGSGYGNLTKLDNTYISPLDTPLINSVVAFIVQVFFCYRIWKINKTYWPICIFIVAIAIVHLVGGIGAAVQGFGHHFSDSRGNVVNAYLWLVGGAAADVLIAVTMTYLLMGSKSNTPRGSQNILVRIVRMTIQTNSLTAGFAVITLILDVAVKSAPIFSTPGYIFGKLYSNTLVATFNHRLTLRVDGRKTGFSRSDNTSGSDSRGVRITTDQLMSEETHSGVELQSHHAKQNA
ncbi:hypothetical protein AMATHDRAFT_71798 [Amanita thiersii Skay4041]|uniref:DUF6534 domain-containing protein n=1 Tax=Amanita thiersii Skay4041 TaxID=703135 RepID=A0A2A9N7D7_9AGAR|nr:hypothetical protein AMATHDRAFT_71798 [Amanita thiersii Skay4041]